MGGGGSRGGGWQRRGVLAPPVAILGRGTNNVEQFGIRKRGNDEVKRAPFNRLYIEAHIGEWGHNNDVNCGGGLRGQRQNICPVAVGKLDRGEDDMRWAVGPKRQGSLSAGPRCSHINGLLAQRNWEVA